MIFAASSIVVGPDLGSLDLRAVHHAGAELDGDRATVAKKHSGRTEDVIVLLRRETTTAPSDLADEGC